MFSRKILKKLQFCVDNFLDGFHARGGGTKEDLQSNGKETTFNCNFLDPTLMIHNLQNVKICF